jgi:hypothetical protein
MGNAQPPAESAMSKTALFRMPHFAIFNPTISSFLNYHFQPATTQLKEAGLIDHGRQA